MRCVRYVAPLAAILWVGLAWTTELSSRRAESRSIAQPLLSDARVPASVGAVLQRACKDCHSESTAWPWYSQVPPISRHIHDDVRRGRTMMNLSQWNEYTEQERRALAFGIVMSTENHLMPTREYVWLHRDAKLTTAELHLIRKWALAYTDPGKRDGSEPRSAATSAGQ